MKILSMTATFGKLEHQTLTLKPGLNIIEAPNEWGKSTWCAFMIAMLYGIDTRERTTQDTLADKEHYAPWSGSPMSGRMDILWKDRPITIERSTKGRTPMGIFRAYETETGLPVPELTGNNCGEVLLGVEKTVFTRSGFLKLTDLPLTQDTALWRRLNALVTTADESGASEALSQKLKELKNQCMSNRANGLIPQALAQKKELENTLSQLRTLQTQQQQLQRRQQQLELQQQNLRNHLAAMEYEASRENTQRLQRAQKAQAQARDELTRLQAVCADYPERWVLEKQQETFTALRQESLSLEMEQQVLPQTPISPAEDSVFAGYSPEEALKAAEADRLAYEKAKKDPKALILALCSLLPLVAGLLLMSHSLIFIICLALFFFGCAGAAACLAARNKSIRKLQEKYGTLDPQQWASRAAAYKRNQESYTLSKARWQTSQEDLAQRQKEFRKKLQVETNGEDPGQALARVSRALRELDALEVARAEMLRAQNHAEALEAVAKSVAAPLFPDNLRYSKEETEALLSDCLYEQRQIINELGRCNGQMDSLGQEQALTQQLSALQQRLSKLEEVYAALEIAQQTLQQASAQLQRRFAPKISQRAGDIMAKLTQGRYDRFLLGEDLSVCAAAEAENTLCQSRWRSDGTVDQLYFALRLAVAEELTPTAPLVLDDALVRFDDVRLAAAMGVLAQEASHKQIILFTCQTREQSVLSSK